MVSLLPHPLMFRALLILLPRALLVLLPRALLILSHPAVVSFSCCLDASLLRAQWFSIFKDIISYVQYKGYKEYDCVLRFSDLYML